MDVLGEVNHGIHDGVVVHGRAAGRLVILVADDLSVDDGGHGGSVEESVVEHVAWIGSRSKREVGILEVS